MRRTCAFFVGMSIEQYIYMLWKHFKSLKIGCRYHSHFKEYFVFKMKSRDFAFGCFQTLQVKNMKSRDFIFFGYDNTQNEIARFRCEIARFRFRPFSTDAIYVTFLMHKNFCRVVGLSRSNRNIPKDAPYLHEKSQSRNILRSSCNSDIANNFFQIISKMMIFNFQILIEKLPILKSPSEVFVMM